MKKEFEIIKEAEVMDNNMLELVKGGGNENTESCCHIQFSCNYKNVTPATPTDVQDPMSLSVQ